ncbi:MAG: hypothetical protein MI717_11295 [Spirochaetales bacterium]|nr:hypothetical protein [Spirochaetales bacterium]
MSIKPIDLQTLFVKLDEVGKEQSIAKDQAALQQSQAARAQVAKELEEDRRVGESTEESEAQAVKDEDEGQSGSQRRGRKSQDDEQAENAPQKEVVTDPQVGKHIDISG